VRPVYLTTNGVSVSAVCPIDQYQSPVNIGLGVIITPAATVTVEHTFDDPFSPTFNPATATWFPHPTLAAIAANQDGNYAYPPRAIRLNQTAGAGSARLAIIQAGATG
jgi:hypothetical protein